MKKTLFSISCAALAAGLLSPTAQALPITNPGFETGDFTGWSETNPSYSAVVSTYTATPTIADGRTYSAPEGTQFAVVVGGGSSTGASAIAQTFTMGVGDILKGWGAFDAREPRLFNDAAVAFIRVLSVDTVLYSKSVTSVDPVGGIGSSDWESWTFTAPTAGDYTIAFAVGNATDNNQTFNSVGLFDLSYTPFSPSPLPDAGSAMLLLGCGLTGVESLRRRLARR